MAGMFIAGKGGTKDRARGGRKPIKTHRQIDMAGIAGKRAGAYVYDL